MAINKILLLEDDRTMLTLLGKVLALEGYASTSSAEFSEPTIFRTIQDEKPDAIFMDVHLDGMDGIGILRSLKSTPEFHRIKILMTSGLDVEQECMRAGADGFLMKPFIPSDLIKWLNTELK